MEFYKHRNIRMLINSYFFNYGIKKIVLVFITVTINRSYGIILFLY